MGSVCSEVLRKAFEAYQERKVEQVPNFMEAWMRIANKLVMTIFFPFLEVALTCVAVLAELPWPQAGVLFRGDLLAKASTRWQLLERLLRQVDAAHPRIVEI